MVQLLDNVEIHYYDNFQESFYFFKVMDSKGECVYDSSQCGVDTNTYSCVYTCTRGYLKYVELLLIKSDKKYSQSDIEEEKKKVMQEIKDYKIKG